MDIRSAVAAIKFADDGECLIEGLAAPFGGPFGGKDLSRQFFSAKTDFALDWFPERPLLWEHGLDSEASIIPVGRVTSWEIKADLGLWVQAQLDKSSKYWDAIKTLIESKKLFFSTSALSHLVKETKSTGELLVWPWCELSFSTHPCNPLATLDVVSKHYEMAGIKSAKLAELKTMSESSDTAGGYTVSDSDAATVRDALSRFDQTPFESDAKKKSAARKIIARAHALNIDVANDSPAMLAAKALPDGATLMSDDEGGPYAEGSYEDLADDIAQALRKQTGEYAYVIATFPEYALVRCCDDDGMDMPGESSMAYFRVAYTLGADGEPVLGDMERVEPAMVPAGKSLPIPQTDEAPLAMQSARLSEYAELVTDRTKAVSDRRIKEGRVLSVANRERLQTSADALEEATKSLRDLLIEPTEPQPAEAASVARLSEIARLKMWGEALSD